MAIAVGIISVAAAAVQAYSAYQQGQQQSAIASYNRKVAENQALAARQAAAADAENQRLQMQRVLATARARRGASGVDEEGSPLLSMMDSEANALLDIQRTYYRGERQAQGYQSEAALQKFYGDAARRQATLKIATSVLQGAAGAYGAYTRTPTTSGYSQASLNAQGYGYL